MSMVLSKSVKKMVKMMFYYPFGLSLRLFVNVTQTESESGFARCLKNKKKLFFCLQLRFVYVKRCSRLLFMGANL